MINHHTSYDARSNNRINICAEVTSAFVGPINLRGCDAGSFHLQVDRSFITMNAVVVIVGLAGLLIPSGQCRRQETSAFQGALEAVQFLTTSSINKRQTGITVGSCSTNQLQNIFANYPTDCLAELTNLDLSGILNQNAAALTEAYRLICQPRCGNPFITFYNQCGLSQLAGILRGLCSRNAAGTFCYEDFIRVIPDGNRVISNCNFFSSDCTSTCQAALRTYSDNSGCCINVLNNTVFSASGSTLNTLSNSLWSRCGVDTPGFCNVQTSTLSSAEAPYFVKALMMLTLVVMAMLLL